MTLSVNQLLGGLVVFSLLVASWFIYHASLVSDLIEETERTVRLEMIKAFDEEKTNIINRQIEKEKQANEILASKEKTLQTLTARLSHVKAELKKRNTNRRCFDPVELREINAAIKSANHTLHGPSTPDSGLSTPPADSRGEQSRPDRLDSYIVAILF